MAEYPVMFTFKEVVSGNGFLAGITLSGRALIEKEGDSEWYVYGTHPGGIADTGTSPMEAFSNFRNKFKTVLFDIAEESANFGAFKAEVERFYRECGKDEEARWNAAARALRSGEFVPEAPLSNLPRQSPQDRPSFVTVDRLDKIDSNRFSTDFNITDKLELPVAA